MLISRLAITLAIAQEEGWFDPFHAAPGELGKPNRPQRNLNPGNLRWAPERFPQAGYDTHHNEPGVDPGYVIFASKESGWAALENDIYAKILKIDSATGTWWNLVKLLEVFCPQGDGSNDPVKYAKDVAKRIKTDALIPLKSVVVEEGRIMKPWASGPGAGPPKPDWDDIVGWATKMGVHR